MNSIKKNRLGGACIIICAVAVLPSTVYAYVGPGAGLSAIGSVLALIAAIVLSIIGFVWFPIKRIWRKYKNRSKASQAPEEKSSDD